MAPAELITGELTAVGTLGAVEGGGGGAIWAIDGMCGGGVAVGDIVGDIWG